MQISFFYISDIPKLFYAFLLRGIHFFFHFLGGGGGGGGILFFLNN